MDWSQINDWILAGLGIYEILSRLIKTNKIWSIIGNILNILHKISEALDRKL